MHSTSLWKIDLNSEDCTSIPVSDLDEQHTIDEISRMLPGGVYTTFRTYDFTKVMAFCRHVERLKNSAELLGTPINLEEKNLRKALRFVITAMDCRELRIRITIDLEKEIGIVYISTEQLKTPAGELYIHGGKAITHLDHRANPKAKLTRHLSVAKTIRSQYRCEGVNEILFVNEDEVVLEGLSSNFFAVKNGIINTASEGILIGTVRSIVLDLANSLKIPIFYAGIRKREISEIEEAFITSTSRSILPIVEIDGSLIGEGTPGPLTKELMAAFQNFVVQRLEEI